MEDADGGPEEGQGKLDQSNGIKDNPREPYFLDPSQNAPWPVYETYDDLESLKGDITNTDELYSNTIVVVIDDQGIHNLGYPGTPKFFTATKTSLGYTRFKPLIIWGIKRKKNIDDIAENAKMRIELGMPVSRTMNMSETMEYIRVNANGGHPDGTPDTRCGVPYIVPNPDLDYSRPPGVTASTSSATTGVTVETKTVNDPKTAGTVTTTEISMADQVKNLKVIIREGKLGLDTAHKLAFDYCKKYNYDKLITMDADFSHEPEEIQKFISLLDENNFNVQTEIKNNLIRKKKYRSSRF